MNSGGDGREGRARPKNVVKFYLRYLGKLMGYVCDLFYFTRYSRKMRESLFCIRIGGAGMALKGGGRCLRGRRFLNNCF